MAVELNRHCRAPLHSTSRSSRIRAGAGGALFTERSDLKLARLQEEDDALKTSLRDRLNSASFSRDGGWRQTAAGADQKHKIDGRNI
jgi:hypothetical protein